MANLFQLLPNHFKHEVGPASSPCPVTLQDELFSSGPWSMRWSYHPLGKQDGLKATMMICCRPSSRKKLAQHLTVDPLRSGDQVTTVTGPVVWYSPCPQGFAVFSNACTELFPPHLVRGVSSLPLPHFKRCDPKGYGFWAGLGQVLH